MVNNQTEFNNKYSQKVKVIKLKCKDFTGSLVIENYSELEGLYLRDVKNINWVIFKNLTKLQEVTIWNCGTKELVIENSPNIKKLNARNNLLTNLDFLKSLEKLEYLEIDGNSNLDSGAEFLPINLKTFSYENTKIIEVLKLCENDWKIYRKTFQELTKLIQQNPQELVKKFLSLQEQNKRLIQNQPIIIDNPNILEQKYKKLKKELGSLLQEKELKTQELNKIITSDLMSQLSGEWKEKKEQMSNLQNLTKELRKKLDSFEQFYQTKKGKIDQKKQELEELKNNFLKKPSDYAKTEEKLNEICKVQSEITINNSDYAREQRNKIRDKLVQKVNLTKGEVDKICHLQTEVTKLEIQLQKNLDQHQQEKQIYQVTIEGGNNINNFGSIFHDHAFGGSINVTHQKSENFISRTEIPLKD